VPGGAAPLPTVPASAEVAALSYPRRSDVDPWIKLNGCAYVSDGYIRAGWSQVTSRLPAQRQLPPA
jgi:hypothetical protein